MGLFGQGGLAGVLADPRMLSMFNEAKTPTQEPRRQRGGGLFGGLRRAFDPTNVQMMQATLSGDYGTAAQIALQQRRLAQERQDAEAEAEAQRQAIEALSQIADREGRPLFTKAQLGGMRHEDLSQLAREYAMPRQFGPQGGSTSDPRTGNYERAPWQQQVGRSIIEGGPNGAPPRTVYEGIEPVTPPPGGFVEGWTNRGPAAPGTIPPPASVTQPPAAAPDEAQLRAQAAEAIRQGADPAQVNQRLEQMLRGGAGSQAPAPFADAGRHRRTAMAESGNRDFANGQPVRSSAGALYAMQTMPATARDPGFGVSPARSNTPAEFNRVGREYIDAMVREFGSEVAGAAAYNYGPGNLRNLMRRHPNNWRNHLPRETRDYLRRQGF